MPESRRSLAMCLIAPLMLTASPVLAQAMGGGGNGSGGGASFGGNGFGGPAIGNTGGQGPAGNGDGGRGDRARPNGNGNPRMSGNADLMAWLAGIGMPDHGEIDEPVTGFANEALWEEERTTVQLAQR